eukprot:TRINITY_DN28406_c0_g1_i1.p1 TRINITY_DN28406_c0_g1~~TRINITY_DN28406_c0_g1_i1.p1  ORF type:complete len:235 (+),score=42.46 TRINITY_DN28406_c0_g1_i1:322-1026(+)
MSLALWRRLGSADFAEAVGWVERTDYAAMYALLPGGATEAAVSVWRTGRHAVSGPSRAQACARLAEQKAWALGARLAAASEPPPPAEGSELQRWRAERATAVGEASVRAAYERLLSPLWDLWRKREAVVAAALASASLDELREVLLQVRGLGGPDRDGLRAGWELALDITTLLPRWPAPPECPAYVTWLRGRIVERRRPPASRACARWLSEGPGRRPGRRRPPATIVVDATGLI